jgi:hypothetical protein
MRQRLLRRMEEEREQALSRLSPRERERFLSAPAFQHLRLMLRDGDLDEREIRMILALDERGEQRSEEELEAIERVIQG